LTSSSQGALLGVMKLCKITLRLCREKGDSFSPILSRELTSAGRQDVSICKQAGFTCRETPIFAERMTVCGEHPFSVAFEWQKPLTPVISAHVSPCGNNAPSQPFTSPRDQQAAVKHRGIFQPPPKNEHRRFSTKKGSSTRLTPHSISMKPDRP
jgi:hypothetical protein